MQFLFSITWGAVSGWWVPACLAAGIIYAWLLYGQPVNLPKPYRYLLFGFRTIAVFLIAFLLLSPLLRSVTYNPQKPIILVLQDNSQSVQSFRSPSGENLNSVATELSALKNQLGNDYDVREFHFSKDLADGLTKEFNGKQTDISNAMKQLNDRFVNQNAGAVIMATDGLYNEGADPQYEAKNIKSVIYTIALGDTVARKDLLIGNISYNKTAFLGDDFEIEVLAEAYQAKGETMRMSVSEDGRQVGSQIADITTNDFHKVETFKLNADKKGAHKFIISVAPVNNEISAQNNVETIYVDVLDAKQKVLLVYDGPHPDISVIRQSIGSNKNYDVKASLLSALTSVKPSDYSLLIFYQISAIGNNVLQGLVKAKVPVWYILGAQSNLPAFNQEQKFLQISSGQQMQEVFAQPVAEFTNFTLSDSTRNKLAALPPLLAPYGSYSSPPAGNTLLKQKIGNVPTSYSLLAFGDEGGQRVGVLTAEGLWRWQLAEYQAYGNHHALEELFAQSVQYLTANANRQRFIVYPSKRVFDEGENVLLNAELYNDALELINTPDVKIDLKSSAGKSYSFLFTRNNQNYQLDAGALPVGEYSYSASTKIGTKTFAASGQLVIKPLNLELRQSAANFQLLRTIAKQSGGTMLMPGQLSQLPALIRKNEQIKTVVYEDKRYNDLVDVKWVFAFILALLSVEWYLRKREGVL